MFKDAMIQYLQESRKPENRNYVSIKEFAKYKLPGGKAYFTPVTGLEQRKIFANSAGGTDSMRFHVATIIEKAENEDGSKIFSIEDNPFLEQVDADILSRISNAIHGKYCVEEAKKNLKADSFKRMMHELADLKGCFVSDLENLTMNEITELIAYYELKAEK